MSKNLEGMVTAVGESDGQIGGIYTTQLAGDAALAATSIIVDNASGFDVPGKLILDGTVYTYTAIALTVPGPSQDTRFTISGLSPAIVTAVPMANADRAIVIDWNRSRTQLDKLRRSFLVNYAESDDLTIIGRNLGVFRNPTVDTDATYRSAIKAIAYAPRGTVYGLELALNALAGPGNYEIIEDVVNFPATVFINIGSNVLLLTPTSLKGKGFLNRKVGPLIGASGSNVLVTAVTGTIGTVQSIRCPNYEPGWTRFQDYAGVGFRPSVVQYTEPPGSAENLWIYTGGTGVETTDIPIAGGFPTLPTTTTAKRWDLLASGGTCRVVGIGNNLRIAALVSFAGAPNTAASRGGQFILTIDNNEASHSVSVSGQSTGPNTYVIGLTNSNPGLSPPADYIAAENEVLLIELVVIGKTEVQLWINNRLIKSIPYTTTTATAGRFMRMGCIAVTGGSSMVTTVRGAEVFTEDLQDYALATLKTGVTSVGSPNLVATSFGVAAGDVGKILRIRNSVANAGGGNSNGQYRVNSIITLSTFVLEGIQQIGEAFVQNATPTRLTITGSEKFRYPEDLGKTITVSGSVLGNNGDYVVSQLLDDTGTSLGTGLSPIPGLAVAAVLTGAAFVTETGLTWARKPVFPADTAVEWDIHRAVYSSGSFQWYTGVPRVTPKLVFSLTAPTSMQLQKQNQILAEPSPGTLPYYAFYLADPFSLFRTYLDSLVAAGIVPEIQLT